MAQYNVRFKNNSSDDVHFVTVNGQALANGNIYHEDLGQTQHRDYTGADKLFDGPRAVVILSTFPLQVKYAEVVDVNHDYFTIKIGDGGLTWSFGNGTW